MNSVRHEILWKHMFDPQAVIAQSSAAVLTKVVAHIHFKIRSNLFGDDIIGLGIEDWFQK